MKKGLIIIGVILVLLLSALAIIPQVFKEDIRKEVETSIANSVNAEVYFGDFGLTFFRNFPSLTVYMMDFGLTGKDEFEGIPLVAMQSFEIEVNLFSLFGDQIKINGISLNSPQVYVKVLEDGKANYDIAISEEDSTQNQETEDSSFAIGIDHWEVTNGQIIYDDEFYNVFMRLMGVNHIGNGNINQDEFDLNTSTVVDTTTFAYEGSEYVSNKRVDIDMILNISNNYGKYTFKENKVMVNDFAFGFEGFLELLEEDMEMDIQFTTQDNSFKSLLSIIPQSLLADFEKLETEGSLAFNGFVRGQYGETNLPAFELNLDVKDARVKYPDLPSSLEDINLDLTISHEKGDIYNTSLDLRNLHLDMGGNPADARIKIDNFIQFPLEGEVNARLNLEELNTIVPVEGLEMKGLFDVKATAKGYYDSIAKIFPSMDIYLGLKDGYIKSADFPIPIEQLNILAEVKNATGHMKDLLININDISMVMAKDRLDAQATIQNMEDYTWDVHVHGGIDLENVMKIYPIEEMNLKGKVKADLDTKGKMSDLDAGRYERMPTSGNVEIQNLSYSSPDLPQGVTISNAKMSLTPKSINIQSYEGTLGSSDISVDGVLGNYMGYALKENETLKGTMNFRSKKFDVNEWMVESEEVEETTSEEIALEVVEIPKNVDFILSSSIASLQYDDLVLKNMNGDVLVKNGILTFKGLKFNTLGGAFAMTGSYNTQDLGHPIYDFDVDIEKLSFAESYSAFSTVKAFAPIAQLISGDFSTDFKIKGELNQDMTPNMSTVNLDGLVEIAQAALVQSDLLTGISSLTKLEGKADKVSLKDVVMKTSIKDGKIKTAPFKVKLGDYDAVVSGSYGLDKKMDYVMTVDVPTGKLGSEVNSALASFTGKEGAVGDMIKLPINIGGTYNKPTFSMGAAQATKTVTDQAKSAVEEKANEEIDKVKEEAKKTAQEESEELKKKAKEKLKKLFGG